MPPSTHVQSYNDWLTDGFKVPYDTDQIFESLMKLNKDMLLILIKVFAGTMPFPQFVMMGYSKSELVHLLIGYMDNDPDNQADNGKGNGKGNVVVLPQPHGGNMAQFPLYNEWLEHGIGDNFVAPRVDKSLKNLDRTTLLILIHVVSAGVHPLLQQMDHAKADLIGTLIEYMVHDNDGLVSKGKGKGKGGPQQDDDDDDSDDPFCNCGDCGAGIHTVLESHICIDGVRRCNLCWDAWSGAGVGSNDDGYIIETVIIQQEGGDQQQEGVGSDDEGVVYIGGEQHFVGDDHTGDQSDGSDESASS